MTAYRALYDSRPKTKNNGVQNAKNYRALRFNSLILQLA